MTRRRPATTGRQRRLEKFTRSAVPLLLLCSALLLAVQPELRLAIPLLVGITAFMMALLALALYSGEQTKQLWPPSVILGVALTLRLLFLFHPPQLSDDIYRHLWDGGNLLKGINPYASAPSSVTPSPELRAIHSRINHPEYVTIYPPTAQLTAAVGAVGGSVTAFKALLVAVDLGLCVLLMQLLRLLGLPVGRVILYAWNPLPLLEIAGSGHLDGAGATLLMGALCLLLLGCRDGEAAPRCRPFFLSGVLLAAACLVKLFPLLLAPLFYLLTPASRRASLVTGFLGGMAALLLPFSPQLANIRGSLHAYALNWEFAGALFTALRAVTGSGTVARVILAGSLLVLLLTTLRTLSRRLRTELSPAARSRHGVEACYLLAMGFLLLTPTLHPWYTLSLAPFLPFCPAPAGIILCWGVLLTYQVQIPFFILGEWREDSRITAGVFLAPVTAYLLARMSQWWTAFSGIDSPRSLTSTRAKPQGKRRNSGRANQLSRRQAKRSGSRE